MSNSDDDQVQLDSTRSVQGRWGVYDAIDSHTQGGYVDSKYPRVQSAGQKVLSSALQKAAIDFDSYDDLWHVFLSHLRKHEFAEEISRQINAIKDEMVSAIKHDCEGDLRVRALKHVMNEVRSEVVDELREKFKKELEPVIESQVKAKLTEEFTVTMKPYVIREIRMELEPKIKEEIRSQLLVDEKLKAEVVDEIKKRLVGL